ncbi:MAG: hypothetical protein LBS36_08810 [Oscillospiraceae bacterium]|jgi:hypothetical protein|nr:hypothetical protein [Oscillospiraceae bacterium]
MTTVLIVDFGSTGNEAEAIRQALELFGYCVVVKHIGRPKDFMDVLEGRVSFGENYIVLSCHGKCGEIEMPVLGKDIYDPFEPKGNFGHNEIVRYLKVKDKCIISLGCKTGTRDLIKAFCRNNNTYIAPVDYVDGNAALLFMIEFFYLLSRKNMNIKAACEQAHRFDEETMLFEFSSDDSQGGNNL